MELTFASYNIHKGVGLDRRRDPERILSVLHEIDADIIALQEADRRIGERASVLPRAEIDDTPWRLVEVADPSRSIGWHGNALLVRRRWMWWPAIRSTCLRWSRVVPPAAGVEGWPLRVIGDLDLSGLRRRDPDPIVVALWRIAGDLPTVIMGDFNQWGLRTGPCASFPMADRHPGAELSSRQPVASLDRIVASRHWRCVSAEVHHTGLSSVASDHLPVTARLKLLTD